MPVEIITSSENVDVGMLAETVSGTLEQDVYELIQTTGAEAEYPSEEATDNTVGDHGGPISKRTTSRGGNLNFPAHLRYDGNKILLAAALRDAWATAVTIVGTSDLNINTAGTHADGSTGLVITGGAGAFADLVTYGGAAANGAEGLLMLVSGSAQAANNQPMMIKNVTATQIDVFDGYTGGGATDPFGAAKVDTTLESLTLRVGEAIRNHQSGSLANQTFSIMIDYFEHATAARFNALRGWKANDIALAINGKGEVMVTVNGMGRGWTPLQATPPNGEAAGSHFVDNTTGNPMYIGGDDLQFLAIVPFPNALVATAVPILLADSNVSAFSATTAGGVSTVGDILGTDEVIPRSGRHDPSGSLTWYQTDATLAEQISQIGAKTTRQDGAIHAGFMDADGQWIVFTYPRNNFKATGPSPGAAGNAVSGTLEFGGMRLSKNARAAIIQQIAPAA